MSKTNTLFLHRQQSAVLSPANCCALPTAVAASSPDTAPAPPAKGFDALALWMCRMGVAGCVRRGPGTMGSLVAAILAPMWFIPLCLLGRSMVLAAIFFVGAVAATRAEKLLRRKDPGEVVVDELLGMWLTLLPFTTVSLEMLLAAFVFFRIFDIFKPWPVKAAEDWMRDGFGVMLDDLIAGCYAMACVGLLHCAGLV